MPYRAEHSAWLATGCIVPTWNRVSFILKNVYIWKLWIKKVHRILEHWGYAVTHALFNFHFPLISENLPLFSENASSQFSFTKSPNIYHLHNLGYSVLPFDLTSNLRSNYSVLSQLWFLLLNKILLSVSTWKNKNYFLS